MNVFGKVEITMSMRVLNVNRQSTTYFVDSND